MNVAQIYAARLNQDLIEVHIAGFNVREVSIVTDFEKAKADSIAFWSDEANHFDLDNDDTQLWDMHKNLVWSYAAHHLRVDADEEDVYEDDPFDPFTDDPTPQLFRPFTPVNSAQEFLDIFGSPSSRTVNLPEIDIDFMQAPNQGPDQDPEDFLRELGDYDDLPDQERADLLSFVQAMDSAARRPREGRVHSVTVPTRIEFAGRLPRRPRI